MSPERSAVRNNLRRAVYVTQATDALHAALEAGCYIKDANEMRERTYTFRHACAGFNRFAVSDALADLHRSLHACAAATRNPDVASMAADAVLMDPKYGAMIDAIDAQHVETMNVTGAVGIDIR